jgi:hypothetical protein
MFSGAQISLYPMTDDFVGVIISALGALDPYRDQLRIETDDISTIGRPSRSAVPRDARSFQRRRSQRQT